jgi:hypothetical protein
MKTNTEIIQCKDTNSPLSVSIKIGKVAVKITERDFKTMAESFKMGGPVQLVSTECQNRDNYSAYDCNTDKGFYSVVFFDSPLGSRDMYIMVGLGPHSSKFVRPAAYEWAISTIVGSFLKFYFEAA